MARHEAMRRAPRCNATSVDGAVYREASESARGVRYSVRGDAFWRARERGKMARQRYYMRSRRRERVIAYAGKDAHAMVPSRNHQPEAEDALYGDAKSA